MSDVSVKLKRIIEEIERLESEKKDLTRQTSDILKEGKAMGFDTKIIKKIVALRRLDPDKRLEEEQLLETYKEALGM
ncbi:MAG: DUF2312 domain-containing protein [Rickettsiales bacterium]|jgi:uncharacterized protein (UPF0335 family)|nr:DUF2312 domain-containing protein [Rickettsiales bacterium]